MSTSYLPSFIKIPSAVLEKKFKNVKSLRRRRTTTDDGRQTQHYDNSSLEPMAQVPMMILVPYKSSDQSREVVMKIRKDGGVWHQVKMIKDKPKDVEKDIPLAATEVNNFKKLDLVVVSKLKTQIIPITPEGGTFTSDVDSRTCVTAIPNTVQWPVELHMKVANVDKMAENRRDLDNVTVISPTHELYFEKKLQKDVLLQMPVNPSKKIRELSHMKALQSCRGTIAKEMTLDSVLDYMKESDFISSEFCSEMKNKKESAKFLDYLERCTTKEFEGLIDALRNTNQTYLARLLEDACVQNSSDYDEDISGSDFEGDITVVVMGSEEADTKLYPWKDLKKEKDTVQINLPKGRDLYRVVGLVAPKAMNDVSIRKMAEKIHDLSMQMPVELLIRQNIKDVSKVCVAWALPEQMPKCIKDVEARGFVSGPKRVINIGIGDGDNVRVTTVGNIQMAVEDQDKLSQQFFSISCPIERVFTIKEGNKKGKVSLGRYVGRIQFFVEGRGRTMMTDSVVCYLPVGDDFQRYAPILLDPEVSIVAKYVGVMLSHQPNSPETFFKDLAGKNYRQLDNRAKKESKDGDSKDRWETFIVNWAAQRPRSENKVKGIVDLMKKHYPDLADKVLAFVHLYSGEKDGLLSTKSLEKLAQEVGRKWEDLGKVLQMDKNEVAEIKEFSQNEVQCAMRMLDHWRFSHDTVHRGMSVIEHLKSALKTAKCSSSAIQLVDRLKP
ncbi:hypothetical protein FSP39_008868 [Pinctada imbricata]|uniref:Death domain-containing protein n=1 Tax=Pinctada imbricata TaxID=66713 RepID=A0AA89BZ26_PINIB|nr:hypothetical protein FSP39_008868 [Pinctada imbricata]